MKAGNFTFCSGNTGKTPMTGKVVKNWGLWET